MLQSLSRATKACLAIALIGHLSEVVDATQAPTQPTEYCSIVHSRSGNACAPISDDIFGLVPARNHDAVRAGRHILDDAFQALEILQKDYFDLEVGTWTEAIDWTAAVSQTIATGMLSTLSKSIKDLSSSQGIGWTAKENLISSYYAQIVNSFFGQDILALRGEAYDDMLWVVLGWLEAIKFVDLHTNLHYMTENGADASGPIGSQGLRGALRSLPWHGHHWINPFAHRSRIFWALSSRGWDTRFCHGGMIWNPRLGPYKNAITNELWIAASAMMYLHFPGDNFTAPWSVDQPFPDKDPAHLEAAIKGYRWLMNVNMTNGQGLFVDGYHINHRKPGNVECDVRDEMVYTYNQGVILTGQRGLWSVTGSPSYLVDGHRLIQSVIRATGWDLARASPFESLGTLKNEPLPRWHGMGRAGIMEEQCDASGTCSQDAQTFKAIFFHHLTNFCNELDPIKIRDGETIDQNGHEKVRIAHRNACQSYLSWTRHNALAALATRDGEGHFGMWWGSSLFDNVVVSREEDGINHKSTNATDYRNEGTPQDALWGRAHQWLPGRNTQMSQGTPDARPEYMAGQQAIGVLTSGPRTSHRTESRHGESRDDPNDRGRGRTVETQLGGLAVVRAFWELSRDS